MVGFSDSVVLGRLELSPSGAEIWSRQASVLLLGALVAMRRVWLALLVVGGGGRNGGASGSGLDTRSGSSAALVGVSTRGIRSGLGDLWITGSFPFRLVVDTCCV